MLWLWLWLSLTLTLAQNWWNLQVIPEESVQPMNSQTACDYQKDQPGYWDILWIFRTLEVRRVHVHQIIMKGCLLASGLLRRVQELWIDGLLRDSWSGLSVPSSEINRNMLLRVSYECKRMAQRIIQWSPPDSPQEVCTEGLGADGSPTDIVLAGPALEWAEESETEERHLVPRDSEEDSSHGRRCMTGSVSCRMRGVAVNQTQVAHEEIAPDDIAGSWNMSAVRDVLFVAIAKGSFATIGELPTYRCHGSVPGAWAEDSGIEESD